MKQQVITFIAAASLSLSALTQAQGEMPTLGSVEGWGCNMNDGQSMNVVVPPGLNPGDPFQVQAPAPVVAAVATVVG